MENILLINNPDSFIKKFNEILSTNKNNLPNNIDDSYNLVKNLIDYIKKFPKKETIFYNLSLKNVQQIINDSYKNLINENKPAKNKFSTDINGTVTLANAEKDFLSKLKDIIPKTYNDFYSYMCILSTKVEPLIYNPNLFITHLECIALFINDDDSLKQSLCIIIYVIKYIILLKQNTNIK